MDEISTLTNDVLTIEQAADLVGVSASTLRKTHREIPDFPRAIGRLAGSKRHLFSQAAITEWLKHHDAISETTEARRKIDQGRSSRWLYVRGEAIFPAINPVAKGFLRGDYLPKAQREQLAFKKLVARTTKPKTHIVQLVHDWMIEDGPRATYRRQA